MIDFSKRIDVGILFLDQFWIFLESPVSNIAILVSLGSGLWVWLNHRREDRFFPKVEYLVGVNFISERTDTWIAEALCGVQNRGISRFSIENLEFDIRYLRADDPLHDGDLKIQHQVNFPHLLKADKWFSKKGKTFAEAQTTQFYKHVLTIPKDAETILIHGRVEYSRKLNGKSVVHSSDATIKVPKDMNEASKINERNIALIRLEAKCLS